MQQLEAELPPGWDPNGMKLPPGMVPLAPGHIPPSSASESMWNQDAVFAFGGKSSKSCGYGEFLGASAWVICLLLIFQLVLAKDTAQGVCAKVEFMWASLWCFLYFLGFCYFCNEWRTNPACPQLCEPGVASHAQAGIAFTFFGIVTFALLAHDDFQRAKYGPGDTTTFSNPYGQNAGDAYVGKTGAGGYQGQVAQM